MLELGPAPQSISKISFESWAWFWNSLKGSDENVCRGSIRVKIYILTIRWAFNCFIYPKNTIITSYSYIEAILSELNNSNCIFSTLNFLSYNQIMEFCILLFDKFCFFFCISHISWVVLFLIFDNFWRRPSPTYISFHSRCSRAHIHRSGW